MITALLLALVQAEAPTKPAPDCSYDLDAMLALNQDAFDQDMDGGWRPLGLIEGCEAETAELIRAWRHEKRNHASILYWHEGQMRAYAGQTEQAIALFKLTYKSADFDADFGWNHYVDGTIAFLTDDREALDIAIDRLKAVPKPTDASFTDLDGNVIQMNWPPNLNVLEGFAMCWGKPYAKAYGTPDCAPPLKDES